MGYRSQVLIALKDEHFKNLLNTCNDETGIEILQGCKIVRKGDWRLMHYDYVKWYDGFNDVNHINKFLNSIEDGYEFHRLGEDTDDYVSLGDTGTSPFDICLVRHMQFDDTSDIEE